MHTLRASLSDPLQVTAVRASAASLLNLVIEGHGECGYRVMWLKSEPSIIALNNEENVLLLLRTARAIITGGHPQNDEDVRAATAQWLWTVASTVADLGGCWSIIN